MAAQSAFLCVALCVIATAALARKASTARSWRLIHLHAHSTLSTSRAFAVVGASTDRSKFGFKILRWYIDHGLGDSTTPINPKESHIEGLDVVKSLDDLPDEPQRSVSIITPPKVTLGVLQAAASKPARGTWIYWCQRASASMRPL